MTKKLGIICVHLCQNPKLDFEAAYDEERTLVCHCENCVKKILSGHEDEIGIEDLRPMCEHCIANLLGKKRLLKKLNKK